MALNHTGRDFLHRWYLQDGEMGPQSLWYSLISLELYLLLKSSTIEHGCYLATNSSGKMACKYPVFCFTIIAWTVWFCWSAGLFVLVVIKCDYMHLASLFLTRALSQGIPNFVDQPRSDNAQGNVSFLLFSFFTAEGSDDQWNFFESWTSYMKPGLFWIAAATILNICLYYYPFSAWNTLI